MKRSNFLLGSTTSAAALTILMTVETGAAQTAATPANAGTTSEFGEIIVTAQKRSESLQKVPFSIAAKSEADLRNLGAASVVDLARNIAGLTIADLGPGQSTVSIRGLSSGQVVRDESSRKETVGIYLDDTPISLALFTPDLDFFDLARVEVLRGPQGTLFGAGAEGGAVRYITKQAKFNKLEGAVEGTFVGVEHGNVGGDIKAALNIPVIDNKLAVRVVGYYDRLPGFIDAITPSGQIQQNVNTGDKYGGRFTATWQPFDSLTITPRVIYQKLKTNGYPRGDISNLFLNPYTTTRPAGTFGPLQQFRQTPEGLTDDFFLFDNTINWDLGFAVATSITSYNDRAVRVLRDSAQLTGQVNGVAIGIPGTTTLDAPLLDRTKIENVSEEFRLSSHEGERLQWVGGVFYNHLDRNYGQTLSATGFTAIFNQVTGAGLDGRASAPLSNNPDNEFVSNFAIATRQIAVFGEATYAILPTLKATAGVRWYDYTEGRTAILTGFFNCGDNLVDCATPANLRNRTTSANGASPRFIISYEAAKDISFNVQASRGFRLGGINDPLITNICQNDIAALGGRDIERFDGESVWNYEAGVKSKFADGRIRFNASAYAQDIRNLQVSVRLACSSTIIVNVPRARTYGFEAEFGTRPLDNLDLNVSFNYNDSAILSPVLIQNGGAAAVDIRRGDQLPTSPKFQLTANSTYTQPLGAGLDGFITASFQHVSSSFSFLADQRNGETINFNVRFGRTSPLAVSLPTRLAAYNIGNLRIGVRKEKNWELAAFINNLWDETAQLALDRERGGEGRVAYLRNQPRTYGLSLRYDF